MSLWTPFRRRARPSTNGCRLYVIGDIHGCHTLLVRLLQMIEADQSQRQPAETHLILLGDYVDRGPRSREVCELLHAMSTTRHVHCLLGNHERMVLSVLNGSRAALRLWLRYGGEETLDSWGIHRELICRALRDEAGEDDLIAALERAVPHPIKDWLNSLRPCHIHGDYLFVHAGIRPRLPIHEQKEEDLLWIREPFLSSKVKHPWRVVHGHSECDEVEVRPNRIGIDTAAYRTGVLTAIGIEEDRHWTIQAVEPRSSIRPEPGGRCDCAPTALRGHSNLTAQST